MIVFKDVSMQYGERAVLRNVNLTIEPQEFVCLTGPSGAGKSTIVQLLIRAITPTAGSVLVDGADIGTLPLPLLQLYRRKTGVLFQDYRLLQDRTVVENIAFALEVADADDQLIEDRLVQLLDMLHITDRADAYPHELSGGELTRVALARALIGSPSILIADEPTGNVDPAHAMEIVEILRSINAQGTTVILATHDKAVVDALGVRVLRLEDGAIIRDSVGGYDAAAVVEPPRAPAPVPAERPVSVRATEEAESSEGALDTSAIAPAPVTPISTSNLPATGRFVPKPSQNRRSPKSKASGDNAPSTSGSIRPQSID